MTTYANIVAPKGTGATMQGLVGAIMEGIGVSTGSFIGGLLIGKIGGSALYRLFAVISIVCGVIHFIVQYALDKMLKDEDLSVHENAKVDIAKKLKQELKASEENGDALNTESLLSDLGEYKEKPEIIKNSPKEAILDKV